MKIVLILTKIKTMEALMRNLIILSTLFLIVSCSDDDAEELGNSAPTASNISILGNSKYGEAMTVSYAYADTENNVFSQLLGQPIINASRTKSEPNSR